MYRDPAYEEFFDIGSFNRSGISIFEAEQIRKEGAESTAKKALEVVSRKNLAGFWIHLDADVVNQSVSPAVDSANPGGITFPQLSELLGVLLVIFPSCWFPHLDTRRLTLIKGLVRPTK